MTFWLSNRLLKQRTVLLTRPPRRGQAGLSPGKTAGEKQPEAYPSHPPTPSCQSSSFPMGYVEDCFDLRTPLEGCFSSRQVVTW
jgi:hypothetical protein